MGNKPLKLLLLIFLPVISFAQDTCDIEQATLDAISQKWKQAHSIQDGHRIASESLTGVDTIDVFVLLISFADAPPPTHANRPLGMLPQDIDSMFFSRSGNGSSGWRDTIPPTLHWNNDKTFGSIAQYWDEASAGHVYVRGKVLNPVAGGAYTWLELPESVSYWRSNFNGVGQVYYAIHKADSLGWWDGQDGHYESFAVIQTGILEPEVTQTVTNVASPFWLGTTQYTIEGLSSYPGIWGNFIQGWDAFGSGGELSFGLAHIGIHAHEFGHAFFGWTDEYSQAPNTGEFDLMATGTYNGATLSSCPALPSAFNRKEMGWVDFNTFYTTNNPITIPYNYLNPIIWESKVHPTNNYHGFLEAGIDSSSVYNIVEEKIDGWFDKYIPSHQSYNQLVRWRMYVERSGNSQIYKRNLPIWLPANSATETYTDGEFSLVGVHKSGANTIINSVVAALDTEDVVTDSVSNIQTTSVSLYGHVNIAGTLTGVGFRIRSNESQTPADSGLALESPITTFSIAHRVFTGLTPNTAYDYQCIACNEYGEQTGVWKTFTTAAVVFKPSVITSAASGVTNDAAQLNGSVNPNGASTTVTIRYGTVTNVLTNSATVATLTGTTFQAVLRSLSGLDASTPYFYKVYATNSAGEDSGSEVSFTTLADPVTEPTVTTNAVTNISSSFTFGGQGVFNTTINPNGGLTTVRFVWGTVTNTYTDSTTLQTISGSSEQSLSYVKNGLLLNQIYYVRARAYNDAGGSQGDEVNFTTLAILPTLTLIAPLNIGLQGATIRGTTHAGGASTADSFLIGTSTGSYSLRYPSAQSPITGQTFTNVSLTLSGLTPSTTYYYVHKGKNSIGTVTTAESTFTTTAIVGSAPTVVTGVATNIRMTTATLNGTVNANNLNTTVQFYWLEVGSEQTDTNFIDYGVIAGTNAVAVSTNLTGLTDSKYYTFNIRASNSQGTIEGVAYTFRTSSPLSHRFLITTPP